MSSKVARVMACMLRLDCQSEARERGQDGKSGRTNGAAAEKRSSGRWCHRLDRRGRLASSTFLCLRRLVAIAPRHSNSYLRPNFSIAPFARIYLILNITPSHLIVHRRFIRPRPQPRPPSHRKNGRPRKPHHDRVAGALHRSHERRLEPRQSAQLLGALGRTVPADERRRQGVGRKVPCSHVSQRESPRRAPAVRS